MKAGVSTVPRGNVSRPRRAAPSLASNSNCMRDIGEGGLLGAGHCRGTRGRAQGLSRRTRPGRAGPGAGAGGRPRSEEHTSELQSLMRISYAVFCLKKKKKKHSSREQHLKHKQN